MLESKERSKNREVVLGFISFIERTSNGHSSGMNYIFRLQKILLLRTNQQDYVCRKEMSKYSKRLICVCKREKKTAKFFERYIEPIVVGSKR